MAPGSESWFEEEVTSPTFFNDPYPAYHRLRAERPIYWSEHLDSWLLTSYDHAVTALRDNRLSGRRTSLFMDRQLSGDLQEAVRPLKRQLESFIAFTDPPDHTRLRKLVSKAFTPSVADGMRPRVQEIVDQLLDAIEGSGTGGLDLIQDLAFPLPAIVIAEALGVPPEDRTRFKRWADDYVPFITTGRLTLEIARTAQEGLAAMKAYLLEIVAERRRQPRNDLLSGFLAAEDQGDRLSLEELLSLCMTMLIGGHETTTNLIGNGTLALLSHPEEAKRLREDPSLIGGAIEEALRFDSPLQRTFRAVKQDLCLDGNWIATGQIVSIMLGAANRDPAHITDPDRFDITRREIKHLGFGLGTHFCIGAPLARLEGEIAITTMLRRLPGLRLATESFEYQPTLGLRALKRLPLAFEVATPASATS